MLGTEDMTGGKIPEDRRAPNAETSRKHEGQSGATGGQRTSKVSGAPGLPLTLPGLEQKLPQCCTPVPLLPPSLGLGSPCKLEENEICH